MKNEKDTSWGSVADWYDTVVNHDDSYQVRVILPHIIRLLKPENGKKIIDIACGEGFFGRGLAALGAHVTGLDIAPELISIAKKRAQHREEYFVMPSDNLSLIKSDSYDAGVIVLALQNIEQYTKTLREAARIIRKGGVFVIVLNHPTFRIPEYSSWGFDESKKVQYRRVDEYLSESRKEIDMNPGAKHGEPKLTTVSFHRPLQAYAKALCGAGFFISRIEEWTSHKKSERGPRQDAENKSRREIPLFMCLECVKQ